jgi:hypothetical protein
MPTAKLGACMMLPEFQAELVGSVGVFSELPETLLSSSTTRLRISYGTAKCCFALVMLVTAVIGFRQAW